MKLVVGWRRNFMENRKLVSVISGTVKIGLVVAVLVLGAWLEFVVDVSCPRTAIYGTTPKDNSKEIVMFGFKNNIMRIAVYYNENLVELTEFKAYYKWWKHLLGPLYWKQDSALGFRIRTGGGQIVTQHSKKLRYVRRGNWDGFFSARTSKESTIVFKDGSIDFEEGTAIFGVSDSAEFLFNDAWDKWTTALESEGKED